MGKYFVIALVLLVLQVSDGSELRCNHRCDHLRPIFDWEKEMSAPGSKVPFLMGLCPPLINSMSCQLDVGKSCYEEETLNEMSIVSFLLREACNNKTDLHKSLANNIDCALKNDMEKLASDCKTLSMEEDELYFSQREKEGTEAEIDREAGCLSGYLLTGCVAAKLRSLCGEGALRTVLMIANQTKQLCSKEEAMVAYAKYLDILTATGPVSDNYVDPLKMFQHAQGRK